ncbi:unnamed protein product [Vicia faba]|nr:unnamed protein product [Vicia faba]
MRHMEYSKDFSSSLPYARVISRILVSCGVELHREPYKKMGIFMDVDGLFKHKNDANVYASSPAPSGGYTLELIYKNMCEMDIRHSFELRELRSDVNFL